MSKRAADAVEEHPTSLKAGERPVADAPPDEIGEFEDEFEDEFESEDEILEAGVDGRPDAEREEEEKGNSYLFLFYLLKVCAWANGRMKNMQMAWKSTKKRLSPEEQNWAPMRSSPPIRLHMICYTR